MRKPIDTQNLLFLNCEIIGCQSELKYFLPAGDRKLSDQNRKLKQELLQPSLRKKINQRERKREKRKPSDTFVVMEITAAYFTGFHDGKIEANITALKRQTGTDWRCRKVGT